MTIINSHINKIILIGGEPTVHPDFISLLRIMDNKQVYLATNGLMFSNKDFLDDCIKTRKEINGYLTGLKSISISLKGYDKCSFLSTSHIDKFKDLCEAIDNINKYNLPVTYSYILADELNQNEMIKILMFLKAYKIYRIVISDVRPYIRDNTIAHPKMIKNSYELFNYLESKGITVFFRPNHPLCEYESDFINHIITNRRLISTCAIKTCRKFFLTSALELIPCNELYMVIMGKYKLNFKNWEELNSLWSSKQIQDIYQKFSGCPQLKCRKCKVWNICGGSCILHWIKEK